MISTLHIKNIGIIDDLSIDLNEGLNVLTGETGAGKTLIIDSLGIISGGRFSKEMIRKGETNSFVEICMYEPENENSIDGNIIVSREINSNGKNMCKINGRMVTVNELKNFMSKFIEIHGQNDNQSLLDNKFHLKYLDGYIGEELSNIKSEYKEKYQRYLEIKRELKANYGDEKEKLEALIKDNNLEGKVILTGFLNKEELYKLYENSSLYIMTSFEESFGLVLVEASSFGLPLIAFDSAIGAKEIIQENGILVSNRDKSVMIKKIKKLMNDISERKLYQKKSLEIYKSYDYTTLIENIISFYQDITNNNIY